MLPQHFDPAPDVTLGRAQRALSSLESSHPSPRGTGWSCEASHHASVAGVISSSNLLDAACHMAAVVGCHQTNLVKPPPVERAGLASNGRTTPPEQEEFATF